MVLLVLLLLGGSGTTVVLPSRRVVTEPIAALTTISSDYATLYAALEALAPDSNLREERAKRLTVALDEELKQPGLRRPPDARDCGSEKPSGCSVTISPNADQLGPTDRDHK